jgi:hypothetical protein
MVLVVMSIQVRVLISAQRWPETDTFNSEPSREKVLRRHTMPAKKKAKKAAPKKKK